MIPPEQTREQRMSALERANEIRSHNSRVKRSLKAGELDVADLILLGPNGPAARIRLETLLLATPRIGPRKTARLLSRTGVPPRKTVGTMTAGQREKVLAEL